MLRIRKILTFRARVAASFLLAAIFVSGLVGGATFALAKSYLTDQRVDTLTRNSFNTLRYVQELTDRSNQVDPESLVTALRARSPGDILVRASGTSFASSISITYESLPGDFTQAVVAGRVGYVLLGEPRHLVFGSPVPKSSAEIYFSYPLDELTETLNTLARILVVVSLSAALIAGILGFRISAAVVRPLRSASQAAERVAAGLIDTRLDTTRDELGVLASSFNQMAEALQERIARERRFVADASHELRTPLTALVASVEYLAERKDRLSPELASTAELALDQARSLRELVDELLELSKIEAGSLQLNIESLDMDEFIRQVVKRRAGDCPVQVEIDPPQLTVAADKIRLERIIGNLVENAVIHGLGAQVRIEVRQEGGVVVITVSDTGPGLPPHELPHMFEPFWTGDSSRRRGAGRGSGLGLAIARENARLIGAVIDVTSGPGGTTLKVRMPMVFELLDRTR